MKDFIQRKIPYETARDKFAQVVGNTSPVDKIRDVLTMQDAPILPSEQDDGDDKNRRKMQKWSTYEDNRLLAAIYRYGIDNWALISKFVGNGRSRAQCAQRWTRCLNPRICKETWDPREDALLVQLVQRFGDHSWTKVAEMMKNRSDVQCRYRYSQLTKESSQNASQSDMVLTAFPVMQNRALDSGAIQLQHPKVVETQYEHRFSMPVIQVIHTYVYPNQPNPAPIAPMNRMMAPMRPPIPMPNQQQQQQQVAQPQPPPLPSSQLDNFLTQFQH